MPVGGGCEFPVQLVQNSKFRVPWPRSGADIHHSNFPFPPFVEIFGQRCQRVLRRAESCHPCHSPFGLDLSPRRRSFTASISGAYLRSSCSKPCPTHTPRAAVTQAHKNGGGVRASPCIVCRNRHSGSHPVLIAGGTDWCVSTPSHEAMQFQVLMLRQAKVGSQRAWREDRRFRVRDFSDDFANTLIPPSPF